MYKRTGGLAGDCGKGTWFDSARTGEWYFGTVCREARDLEAAKAAGYYPEPPQPAAPVVPILAPSGAAACYPDESPELCAARIQGDIAAQTAARQRDDLWRFFAGVSEDLPETDTSTNWTPYLIGAAVLIAAGMLIGRR